MKTHQILLLLVALINCVVVIVAYIRGEVK
jgi:hypothetical protein